ncbi:MAG: hypothetical protein ACRDD7_08505 [Peptostreptococcaceae bacterium]
MSKKQNLIEKLSKFEGCTIEKHIENTGTGDTITNYYLYNNDMQCLTVLYINAGRPIISTYENMRHYDNKNKMMGKPMCYDITESQAIQWLENPTKGNNIILAAREENRIKHINKDSDDLAF